MGYDIKYRQRVLEYMNEGHAENEAAEVFNVSTFAIWSWKTKLKETCLRMILLLAGALLAAISILGLCAKGS